MPIFVIRWIYIFAIIYSTSFHLHEDDFLKKSTITRHCYFFGGIKHEIVLLELRCVKKSIEPDEALLNVQKLFFSRRSRFYRRCIRNTTRENKWETWMLFSRFFCWIPFSSRYLGWCGRVSIHHFLTWPTFIQPFIAPRIFRLAWNADQPCRAKSLDFP